MKNAVSQYYRPVLICILAVLLVLKYLWTLVYFQVPLGYDAGIYRYLFSVHAGGWPPWLLADAPNWIQSHPPGLFFFSAILMKLGVPVDWLIGWMWNLFPVALTLLFAWTWRKREPQVRGLSAVLLLCALLSSVQFDGFVAMYWKVFAAFAWCVLSFYLIERRSAWWILAGMFTLATHLQVGLILGVSVCSLLVSHLLGDRFQEAKFVCWTGIAALALGALWYLPSYSISVEPLLEPVFHSLGKVLAGLFVLVALCVADIVFLSNRKQLRQSIGKLLPYGFIVGTITVALVDAVTDIPGTGGVPGSFITLSVYATSSFPLIVLGLTGLLLSLKRERGSVWQWAVLWCSAFTLIGFFFHLRFILPLDFFLLPFCALGVRELWQTRAAGMRVIVACLLVVQAFMTFSHVRDVRPDFEKAQLERIKTIGAAIPVGSTVLVLENITAPWVLGYTPQALVVAPGIFESPTRDQWTGFLYGLHEERVAYLRTLKMPLFLYASSVFNSYYSSDVTSLLSDACMESTPYDEVKYFLCTTWNGDPTP
jgi:hypothetical protein